jgi:hypothetical protein
LFGLSLTPQYIPNSIFDPVLLSSYSLSIATTVVSTVIIVIQILMVSRMPGSSCQLTSAMEIIVESAALYSISALVYTPIVAQLSAATAHVAMYQLYADIFFAYMAIESSFLSFPSSSPNSSLQNFAPALIMLRVVLGRACPDTEWSGKISGLQSNSASGIPLHESVC